MRVNGEEWRGLDHAARLGVEVTRTGATAWIAWRPVETLGELSQFFAVQ
jgi:hypothetical protein